MPTEEFERPRGANREIICQQCGEVFTASSWDIAHGRKFCSPHCYHQSKIHGVKRICQQCGETFLVPQSREKRKFCSKHCLALSMVNKIERTCQWCGKKFMVVSSQVKYGKGRYCSNSCSGHGTQDAAEARARMSKVHKGGKLTREHIQHMAQAIAKRYQDPELRKQCSLSAIQLNKDPVIRERKRQAMLGRKQSQDEKDKRSKTQKSHWQDPEFVKKAMLAFNKKPTTPERQLEDILNKHFPEFKYNGDGRLGVTLGGLVPDFVNVNGKKQVIEVFGDYWHRRTSRSNYSELGRIMAYNSVGFKCLIIWESEFKKLTEQQIIGKIKTFTVSRQHGR